MRRASEVLNHRLVASVGCRHSVRLCAGVRFARGSGVPFGRPRARTSGNHGRRLRSTGRRRFACSTGRAGPLRLTDRRRFASLRRAEERRFARPAGVRFRHPLGAGFGQLLALTSLTCAGVHFAQSWSSSFAKALAFASVGCWRSRHSTKPRFVLNARHRTTVLLRPCDCLSHHCYAACDLRPPMASLASTTDNSLPNKIHCAQLSTMRKLSTAHTT